MTTTTGIEPDATRWIVIPKGFDLKRRVLSVTLQWVPSENFDMLHCGWPDIASRTSLSIALRAADDRAKLWYYTGEAAPWKDPIDHELWANVFSSYGPKAGIRPTVTAKPRSVMAWETGKLSTYLSSIVAAMTEGHLSFGRQHAERLRSDQTTLSAMMPVVWTRSLMRDRSQLAKLRAADPASNYGNLCGAFGAVLSAYMPSTPSAQDVNDWFRKKQATMRDREAEILVQVRQAYGYAPDAPPAAGKQVKEPTWQEKLAGKGTGGLRYEQVRDLVSDILHRIDHADARGRTADTDRAILFEFLTGTLPWNSKNANQARDEDSPRPLAGVGQSFTLQTKLGMICDFDLELAKWPAEARRKLLAGDKVEISAVPASLLKSDPHKPRAWTAMNGQGLPDDDTPRGSSEQDGLYPLDGAHFTTLEVRQSMQRFIITSQKSQGKLDYVSQAPLALPIDTPFDPAFRSGPLQLLRKGAAQATVRRRTGSQADKCGDKGEVVFCLSDLTIGIRPDLQITYSSRGRLSPWRPMLGRVISYRLRECTFEATQGDQKAGRMEGYLPLTRMSGTTTDTLTTDDELFAWHGWNPSLPVPGAAGKKGQEPPLKHVITPIDDSNPMFRYGSRIWARARRVLRDGSSLSVPSSHTSIPAGFIAPNDSPAASKTGFAIRRYEPLKAPALLLAEPLDSSVWLPPESLGHVIVGTCRRYPSLSRERSARYWLPGAMRDISEVERHGAFDQGATPRATAFPYHARCGDDFETVPPPPSPYPAVAQAAAAGSAPIPASAPAPAPASAPAPGPAATPQRLPIFRIGSPPYRVKRPYHPDPLVRGVVLSLARRSENGQWLPVLQGTHSLCWVHPFYTQERRWPDAIALRIEVSGRASGTQAACRYIAPASRVGDALVDIHVPSGERLWLVAWPYGDPLRLNETHAFCPLAAHWDRFVNAESQPETPLDFPIEGVSGLISETATLLIDHFVDVPDAPSLQPEPVAIARAPLSAQQPFALSACATPGSTGGIEVIARWIDPVDDPGTDAPVCPASLESDVHRYRQASVCVMTPALNVAADMALSDARVNKVLRPPIAVPHKYTQVGTYALPDTCHRYVRYIPIAHSALPKPGGGLLADDKLRTCEGPGISVNVLASACPRVPVVRDVAPSFPFERAQHSNSARSRRLTAVTLTLERGWWSSGPDELLAINVSDPSASLDSLNGARQTVSAWGGDPALSIDGKIHQLLTAADFGQTEQWVDPKQARKASDGQAPANVVLYRPEFDFLQKCWRVNMQLHTPTGAAQPFLQLALVRYQPNAIADMNFSDIVLADFIQLQDKRHATIVPDPHDQTKFRITVRGPVADGHLERACANERRCTAKSGTAGQSGTCCVARRRSIEAWLELAPRRPGHAPLWKQHGATALLDPEMDADSFVWSGELTAQQQLELPTQRMRVCLMERGYFPRQPVRDSPNDLHHGPLYYQDQVEFSVTDYNGDDHP